MTTLEDERADFERIQKHFQFLADSGMTAHRTEQIGDPPGRDAGFISRFEDSEWEVEISWTSFELSLGVLLIYNSNKLSRPERYVWFERLVEFLTEGREKAIVPYVAENMSLRSIKRVIEERKVAFGSGPEPIAERLGQKLKHHLHELRSISTEQIKAYHKWIAAIR